MSKCLYLSWRDLYRKLQSINRCKSELTKAKRFLDRLGSYTLEDVVLDDSGLRKLGFINLVKNRILIIEHQPTEVLDDLKAWLLSEGFDVDAVRSVETVLESVTLREYDVMILDISHAPETRDSFWKKLSKRCNGPIFTLSAFDPKRQDELLTRLHAYAEGIQKAREHANVSRIAAAHLLTILSFWRDPEIPI